ncbi:MAG TPA: hypothetical protein VGE07_01530 [Herpetosiphonaceae bacterium]
MAISSNALSLAAYCLMSNDPIVQAIGWSLIENGSILDDIPLVNQQTLLANGTRWEGNLPTVNWSNLNEEGAVTSGVPTPFQEQAFIIRNNIDTDKFLVLDKNQIADPRGVQLAAYMKAVAYEFNHLFINNNHTSGNAKAIVGLRERIDNGAKYGVRSENKIAGGGVDMTSGAMTAATFAAFTELVDQLLWSVGSPSGAGVVLYLNDVMKRRWDRALRQFSGAGGFSTATDQFGRTIEMYKGAVIRDIGLKADQSTKIITATETAAGADSNNTHTSIYAAHFGMDQLMGWQFEELQGRDLGLMENGAIYRTSIDWAGGLYPNTTRCVARLHGIKLS